GQALYVDPAAGCDAGVVDQQVEAVPVLAAPLNRGLPVMLMPYVQPQVLHVAIGRRRQVGREDFVALLKQLADQCGAQSGRGARAQRWPCGAPHSASRYLASSSFAMTPRCPSSGPSASRSERAEVHAAASGKSSDNPPPPCNWIAMSITSCAIRGTATLIW